MGRPPKRTSDFDAKLGAVVRSKRFKIGLSQQDVADATGIALSNYKRREAGTNEMGVEAAKEQLGHASSAVTRKHYIQPLAVAPDVSGALAGWLESSE